MNDLNFTYIGKELKLVYDRLSEQNYDVVVEKLQAQKDKDILNEEIVIKLEKRGNTIVLITSMFKKYI